MPTPEKDIINFSLNRSISRRDLLKVSGALFISGAGIVLLGCGKKEEKISVRELQSESNLVLIERDNDFFDNDHVIGAKDGNFFITSGRGISAKDINSGSKLWSTELKDSIKDGLVRPNGNLFITSDILGSTGNAYIIDGKTGSIVKKTSLSFHRFPGYLLPSILEDKYVEGTWIPSLEPFDKNKSKNYQPGFLNLDNLRFLTGFSSQSVLRPFAVTGAVALFSTENDTVVAFDINTKSKLWEGNYGWLSFNNPSSSIVIAGKTLDEEDRLFKFAALDSETGKSLWDWEWRGGGHNKKSRGESGSYTENQQQLIYADSSGFYVLETKLDVDYSGRFSSSDKTLKIKKRRANDGKVLWEKRLGGGSFFGNIYTGGGRVQGSFKDNSLAWLDEKQVVIAHIGGVTVIDSETGDILDNARLPNKIRDPRNIIDESSGRFDRRKVTTNDQQIFIGLDDQLVSIDRSTGLLRLEMLFKHPNPRDTLGREEIKELAISDGRLVVITGNSDSVFTRRMYRFQIKK